MDVEIDGLLFDRGGHFVLDIPSLRFTADRTTAVLGPNGAGKTTLLRLIAGLERPTHGRILIGAAPVHSAVRLRRSLAYVFQEEVFLRQSVSANLDLGLRVRGLDRTERRRRIEHAAHLLGITHLLDRRPDRLSRGECRRASLARALCLRAPVVLLDEPLDGLDLPTYSRLLDELPQVLDAFQSTTLLVTHDRDEALRLGQDLVVFVDGRVHAAGDKHEIVLNPREVTVAQILGYTILNADGRRIAVRPGTLRLGPGALAFRMVAEDVIDLVHQREVVGCIGEVRVHVPVAPTAAVPTRGDVLIVHTDWACEVS